MILFKFKSLKIILPLFLFLTILLIRSPHSYALNYTDHPMDDSPFRANFTMSAQAIQNFLVSMNSGLVNFSDIENCGSTSGPNYS